MVLLVLSARSAFNAAMVVAQDQFEELSEPRFEQRLGDRAFALILVLGELEKALDEIEKKTTDPE